jgi:hypothetical protein
MEVLGPVLLAVILIGLLVVLRMRRRPLQPKPQEESMFVTAPARSIEPSTGHGLTGIPRVHGGGSLAGKLSARARSTASSLFDAARCAALLWKGAGADISMILPSGREPRAADQLVQLLRIRLRDVTRDGTPASPRTMELGGIRPCGRGGSSKGHRHLRFQSPCEVSSMASVFRRISLALEASPFAPLTTSRNLFALRALS